MTRDEEKAWEQVTESSRYTWTQDLVTFHNRGELLFYRGGESGSFISITKAGLLTAGAYEYAFPHIGEAEFTIKVTEQYPSLDDATIAVSEKLGVGFLMETIFR